MIDICKIQRYLGLVETGEPDELLYAGIRNYQLRNDLPVTGEPDIKLYSHMFPNIAVAPDISTDLSESIIPKMDLYQLPKDEYFQTETKKEYIFLHHTAGWNNPYTTIKNWADDDRGKIATKYVIGGINPKTSDMLHDGVIVQSFPENGYAWHLGAVDQYMHQHSIGIEICNFGWLTKSGVNFYTYTNTLVNKAMVCELGYEFRGYRYWHRYSDKQISAVKELLLYLSKIHKIDLSIGIIDRLNRMGPSEALDTYTEAKTGKVKGLLSHTSVRSDKTDIFPQVEMIQMLKSIVKK